VEKNTLTRTYQIGRLLQIHTRHKRCTPYFHQVGCSWVSNRQTPCSTPHWEAVAQRCGSWLPPLLLSGPQTAGQTLPGCPKKSMEMISGVVGFVSLSTARGSTTLPFKSVLCSCLRHYIQQETLQCAIAQAAPTVVDSDTVVRTQLSARLWTARQSRQHQNN